MNVPNHEKKAFKDLTPEERSAIVEALIEKRHDVYANDAWHPAAPFIDIFTIYRTRPRKLVIPWKHIKPEYKWVAMDEDGGLYAYTCKPKQCSEYIPNPECEVESINALNIDTAGIDWRESLTQRPE